jgi:hypothetical protein
LLLWGVFLGLLHDDQGKMVKKSIWRRKKSGGSGRPMPPGFPRSGGKVKKVCPFTNLASLTDPLKGQLFTKKGVKYL